MALGDRRLAWQQPIQSKQKEVYVYSEEELIDQIGQLVIETREFPGLAKGYFPGKIIKIGKGFTVTSTIVIPSTAVGLVLDGTRTSLTPGTDDMILFENHASAVTFMNFYLGGADSLATAFFGTLVKLADFSDGVRVVDNHITGTRLVNGASASSCDKLVIRGNTCSVTDNPTWIELVESSRSVISHNIFDAGGGASNIGVVLGSNCTECCVVGNAFDNCDITTNGSSGLNTVVGNSNLGTTALHASDSNTGNT